MRLEQSVAFNTSELHQGYISVKIVNLAHSYLRLSPYLLLLSLVILVS